MVVYNPWIIKNIFSYLCHSKFCQVASTTTYDQHFQLTVFPSQIDLLSMNFWNPELVTKLLYLSPISMHSFVTQAKNSVIFSLVFPKVISAIMVNFKWQKISICKWELKNPFGYATPMFISRQKLRSGKHYLREFKRQKVSHSRWEKQFNIFRWILLATSTFCHNRTSQLWFNIVKDNFNWLYQLVLHLLISFLLSLFYFVEIFPINTRPARKKRNLALH